MILKHKDDLAPHLAELELLLAVPELTPSQRESIQDEITAMRAGDRGEKEAAYHIDFGWKDGKNSAVIHDLRIEHNGRVAQIDHLIINRVLHCHVIESKGYSREVRISDVGEWEVKTRYGWKGIPSPIEQNRRHIEVLKSFLSENQLLPKRLGLAMPMTFHNWVLVSPSAQLRRHAADLENVVKMDMFETALMKRNDKAGMLETLGSVSKWVSLETVERLAQDLIRAHKPSMFNFAAKFGISQGAMEKAKYGGPSQKSKPEPKRGLKYGPRIETISARIAEPLPELKIAPKPVTDPAPLQCQSCTAPLEAKVISFCRLNSKKFNGKLLCQPCQKAAPSPVMISCEACGTALDDKVIAFCRFNSKRFGGKKLCRSCQGSLSK